MSLNSCFRGHLAFMAGTLLALGLVTSSRLNAQGTTSASILGTVTDPAGGLVPNASVQVKNVATGQV